MTDVGRARRLAGRIREIVANTLERQVKDPRLGMVTITDARLTPDLREATVFYTVYGDEATQAASAAALESARGVLRTQVGRQTGVRFTPSLTFVADTVPRQAEQIEDLLTRARESDAELRRAREGAQYAGEPDPYRRPPDADEEDDPDTGGPTGSAGSIESTESTRDDNGPGGPNHPTAP